MSTNPINGPPIQEEEEQGVTPAFPVTEAQRPAPIELQVSAPPSQSQPGRPVIGPYPSRWRREQHFAQPPQSYPSYHAGGDQFPGNTSSGKQRPYRVVTSYVVYPDEEGYSGGPRGVAEREAPTERVYFGPENVREFAGGPSYETRQRTGPNSRSGPYWGPADRNYCGAGEGEYYGGMEGHVDREAPIAAGHYTHRELQILGRAPRQSIAHLFNEPNYRHLKTPEHFFQPAPPPKHLHTRYHQPPHPHPRSYERYTQHPDGHAPPTHAYNAPPGYPQRETRQQHAPRIRMVKDERMSASELARRQAQRPDKAEPTQQPPLRRLFGSKRRNERKERDELARRNNYYY